MPSSSNGSPAPMLAPLGSEVMAGVGMTATAGMMVKATGSEAAISRPASSTTTKRRVCGPSASASGNSNRHRPSASAVVSPNSVAPSKICTVAPGTAVPSRAVTSSAANVVPLAGRVMAGVTGGTREGMMVKATGSETATSLPFLSTTTARTLCGPSGKGVGSGSSTLPCASAVASPNRFSPSKNRTVAPGSAVPSRACSSSPPKVAPVLGWVKAGDAVTRVSGPGRNGSTTRGMARITAIMSLKMSSGRSQKIRLAMGLPPLCQMRHRMLFLSDERRHPELSASGLKAQDARHAVCRTPELIGASRRPSPQVGDSGFPYHIRIACVRTMPDLALARSSRQSQTPATLRAG